MRPNGNGWAVALRIARRSALTYWGRSLLIIALIAIPIIGLAGVAVLLPSTQSTLAERLQGNLGHAQAKLMVVGGPKDGIEQGVEGLYDYTVKGGGGDSTRIDPRTVLPRTVRVLAIGSAAATFATPGGETSMQVTTGPSWDPSLNGGPYVLLSGHRPTSAREVLLSPAALKRLGVKVGGTITMQQPELRTLSVVGTARDRSIGSSTQSVFAAASVLGAGQQAVVPSTFYVPTTPIGWATVQRLNAIGTTVMSREVIANPPALPARLQFGSSSAFPFNAATSTLLALLVIFAVLEVALLAGAAFLVGARLQQRVLATIASVGADIGTLRRVVTASGVVLGTVGGAVGVGLGIAGASLVMQVTGDGSWTRYPGLHLIWPLLIGIAVFGALVGWIAALVPAHAASRFDVVQALRGARTPAKVGKRPVAGMGLLLAGVVMTLAGGGALIAALKLPANSGAQVGALALLGGGSVLAQLGVLLCAGLILRGVSRVLSRAPLAARLAARDTSRNLGRAVPALASVMTTVFIAAFVMCIANATSITAALTYHWNTAIPGEGLAQVTSSTPMSPAESTAAAARWDMIFRQDLPVRTSATLASSISYSDDPTPSNRTADALPMVRFPDPPADCTPQSRLDTGNLRCGPFIATGPSSSAATAVSVGDAAALGLLLGHTPSNEALAALDHGKAVALRSDIARTGTATIDWFTPKQLNGDITTERPRRTTHLAAVTDLPTHPVIDSLFVTAATAKKLHLPLQTDRVLMTFKRPPTDVELDTINQALSAIANSPGAKFLSIEHGPQDVGSVVAWYALLACLIIAISAGATAIGLARIDGKADDLTLASLGASPRIRRSIAFVQAIIICGIGAVIGTLLGLLPAFALGGSLPGFALGIDTASAPFAPPTLQLVLAAIGVPLLIATGSWLLVGNRGDLTRRAAIG